MKTPTALLACLLAAVPAVTLAGPPQQHGGGEHGYTRSAPVQRSSYQQAPQRMNYAPQQRSYAPQQRNYAQPRSFTPPQNYAAHQNYVPRQNYAPRQNYTVRQNYNVRSGYVQHYTTNRVVINAYGGRGYDVGRWRGWAPQPAFWGGGFWGSLTIGLAPSAYVVQGDSPGADLLAEYGLQQTDCDQPNLVSIQGPDGGEICAYPNDEVAPGAYSVDLSNMTLVSQ